MCKENNDDQNKDEGKDKFIHKLDFRTWAELKDNSEKKEKLAKKKE